MKTTVILGGGGAGLFTGATIKQFSPKDKVIMISDEDLFCRCSSPYVITQRAKFEHTIMPDSMTTDMGIELIKGLALSVDKEKKVVNFQRKNVSGTENIKYDTLVFATGVRAFIPPFEGCDLKKVLPMRRGEDLEKILKTLQNARSVVVVGGGVIGVEMASAIREQKGKNFPVSIIDINSKILTPSANPQFSDLIQSHLESQNIHLYMDSMVQKIEDKNQQKSITFSTKNEGQNQIEADFVILATGGRANTGIASEAGIQTEKFGIPVNEFFQTSEPNIYAVGDVAVAKNIVNGKNSVSQLASNAVIQGKICGQNIVGMKIPYQGHTSAMGIQFLGKEFGACGLNEKSCEEQNIEYEKITVTSTDTYQDLDEATPVSVEMLFEKDSLRILGIQVFGKKVVGYIDTISLAIQNQNTAFDLLNWHYVSHPAFTPWPFMNPVVMAAEKIIGKMNK